jgi:hypothetical protein
MNKKKEKKKAMDGKKKFSCAKMRHLYRCQGLLVGIIKKPSGSIFYPSTCAGKGRRTEPEGFFSSTFQQM